MYDVITVGSATVDVFARTHFSELIRIMDPKGETDLLAFPCGSKILIDGLEFTIGGGGTNTAVALARLGHKVGYLGKLGEGTNSDFIHKHLVKENIDLLCAHGKGNAGYSIILDSLKHDRTILAYKGANDHLSLKDVPLRKLKTRWFYFGAMMDESFRTQVRLAQHAEKNGILIAFNPSMYLAELGAVRLKPILSRTHLLVLNKEEAALLAGKGSQEAILKRLHSLGPSIVVITDGKNKVYASDGSAVYSALPPPVKVVDSTGAGDAFAASFLSGLLRGKKIEFALKLGMINSRSVLTNYGAKNILLSRTKAIALMKKATIRITKKRIR